MKAKKARDTIRKYEKEASRCERRAEILTARANGYREEIAKLHRELAKEEPHKI